jgi:hypothetical protein
MSPPIPPSSSLPPAGVPDSSGNTKYAVIAVLLVVAAGGIFAWRTFASRSQPPAPAPAAALEAPRPENPKIEDVPAPPPLEEKPDAAAGPRIIYVQAGNCEGKCSGVASPELVGALTVRGNQARRCYNQALASDSSLRGHVTVAVRVGSTGNVCSASVASNDMGSASVANCAVNIFRQSGGLPSPRGGCVDANVPLSFVPQTAAPQGGQ